MLGIVFMKERHIPCIPYKQGTWASIPKSAFVTNHGKYAKESSAAHACVCRACVQLIPMQMVYGFSPLERVLDRLFDQNK